MKHSSRLNRAQFGFVLSACLLSLAARATTLTPLTTLEDPTVWGTAPNEQSIFCSMSSTGSVIAFESAAVNLVANDRNGRSDIFVSAGGTLQRASNRVSGADGRRNASRVDLNGSGRFAVFLSGDDLLETAGGVEQPNTVFLRDLQTGALSRPATTLSGSAALVTDLPRITNNGRYVLFVSQDANLVAGNTNNAADAFHYDTQTGAMLRVSTKAGGGQMSNSVFGAAAMDASGDIIAFAATDGDLVAGDTNARVDVFVKRISTGAVVRASQTAAAVAGDRDSLNVEVSSNGAFVVFEGSSTNLVAGDTNNTVDTFRYELASAQLLRASVGSAGEESTSASNVAGVSPNGRLVYFESVGNNIGGTGTTAQLFRKDLGTGTTTRLTNLAFGVLRSRVNDSGDVACFTTADAMDAGDGNWMRDVYRLDIISGTYTHISVANSLVPVPYGSGRTDPPDIARNASRVIAVSHATDLDADSFDELGALVRTNGGAEPQLPEIAPATNAIRLLGRAGGTGGLPQPSGVSSTRVSADGTRIAFITGAANLDARATGTNVYRQTLPSGAPELISLGIDNVGAGGCSNSVLDGNGARVAFQSTATNLVTGDTNAQGDVFVWDASTGVQRVSVSSAGDQADGVSEAPDLSENGELVAFTLRATNLVANDTNAVGDVFIHHRLTGVTERVSLDAFGAQRPASSAHASISRDGRHVAYYYTGTIANDGGYYVYDRVAATTTAIAVPVGVTVGVGSARFGGDGRYLSLLASEATGSIAYRYDLSAGSLRELLRTSANIYEINNAPHGIASVRVASATQAVLSTNQPLGEFDRNSEYDLALVTLDPGTVAFTAPTLCVSEGAGNVQIAIVRAGAAEGSVDAVASFPGQTATVGIDYTPTVTSATWADNENAMRQFAIGIVDDSAIEGNETLRAQLTTLGGGVLAGVPNQVLITIVDNDFADPIFANGFE